MNRTNTTKISSRDNFIDAFQKDHGRLLALFTYFQKAVEVSKRDEAKEILSQINAISEGHFSFEETYFYPRLRRLVSEITEKLRNEQQMMRAFVRKSQDALNKDLNTDNFHKEDLSGILEMLPRLSVFMMQCNDLVHLAKRFNKEDREDLDKRFKECHSSARNGACQKVG